LAVHKSLLKYNKKDTNCYYSPYLTQGESKHFTLLNIYIYIIIDKDNLVNTNLCQIYLYFLLK